MMISKPRPTKDYWAQFKTFHDGVTAIVREVTVKPDPVMAEKYRQLVDTSKNTKSDTLF